MNYGLYLSAAGMQAQQLRQSVVSNNLANIKTTGFKRDLAVMQSRANAVDEDPRMAGYRLPVVEDQGGGVFALGGGIDLSQGTFDTTGNMTDFGLKGRGFFTVEGENGQKLLTRDGKFLMNDQGELVMAGNGRRLLGADGKPIVLNPKLPVFVDQTGVVSQGAAESGVKLGVVEVADSRQLRKVGSNLLSASGATTEKPADTLILQGKLEASGVDPMAEMVAMMEGMRSFEANARMITFQDQTMQQLNQIGRVA